MPAPGPKLLSTTALAGPAGYALHHDPLSSHQQIARILRKIRRDPILDVGASFGFLGQLLSGSKLAIDAIEPDESWAEQAARFYRQVYRVAVEDAPLRPGHYEVVVCADVLEHTVSPSAVLCELQQASAPDAHFIVSLPNAVHLYARVSVLAGHFPQMDRGIFDRTHLHFFTRRTARDMLRAAGLSVIECVPTPVPLAVFARLRRSRVVLRLLMLIQRLLLTIWPTLFAYQWIFVAQPGGDATRPTGAAPSTTVVRAPDTPRRDVARVPPIRARPAERRALVYLISALVALSIAPAIFGYRQISRYGRLALTHVQVEREVRYSPQGQRPMSGANGLALSREGAVYVADTNQGRVLVFPCGRSDCGSALESGSAAVPLQLPFAVALAPSGELYVLDGATGFVHSYAPDGRGLGTEKLAEAGARDIAVDSRGNIFIADTDRRRVRKFLPNKVLDPSWTDGVSAGQVSINSELCGIAVTDEFVYVTVALPHSVIKLDRTGKQVATHPTVGNAGRLASGPDGRLFMSDLGASRLWVLDADGRTVGRVVGPGDDETMFGQPRGVGFDRDGNLYVVNENHVTVYTLEAE